MNLADLIRTTAWPDVKASLLWLFPDDHESVAAYRQVFRESRRIAPSPSQMRISMRTTFREGLDDKPFQEVIGVNGTLNRDQDDFKHCGKAADSPFALEETAFALAMEPWEKWLGMEIDSETLNGHAAPQIVAHCLWEMTFHGFSQTQIREEREELERRVAELDAMTAEERKRNLIPAEEVFKKLKANLEEPS